MRSRTADVFLFKQTSLTPDGTGARAIRAHRARAGVHRYVVAPRHQGAARNLPASDCLSVMPAALCRPDRAAARGRVVHGLDLRRAACRNWWNAKTHPDYASWMAIEFESMFQDITIPRAQRLDLVDGARRASCWACSPAARWSAAWCSAAAFAAVRLLPFRASSSMCPALQAPRDHRQSAGRYADADVERAQGRSQPAAGAGTGRARDEAADRRRVRPPGEGNPPWRADRRRAASSARSTSACAR